MNVFLLSFFSVAILAQSVPTSKVAKGPVPTTKNTRDALTCFLCTDVFGQMKKAIKENSVQQDLMNGIVNQICPLLPPPVGDECTTKVKVYGPLVFEMIYSRLDPKAFCQELTLCSLTAVGTKPSQPRSLLTIMRAFARASVRIMVPFPLPCNTCKALVNTSLHFLTTNATEAELGKQLVKSCSVFPQAVAEQCSSFLGEYAVLIVDMALKRPGNAQDLCSCLGFCDDGKVAGSSMKRLTSKIQKNTLYFKSSVKN